ncbi:hypothetical protein [Petroclostridium sp. X23]|uniref:hypothetical protein n=1 Tax=Petroclostridium sp. X23 TaxID=3045146 RepID=UPI0024ACF718|nr:hypothetical protein [Petroclostridium sp. X23]WHH59588.1 hypothetical protein QKW49_02165 [Petroclostridium sp. X23]
MTLKVISRVWINDELKNMDDLTPEEKAEVAAKLNKQALEALGYKVKEKDVG